LRREIAQTRGELGETIVALEERINETREAVIDKVSPSRIWQRKTAELRGRLHHVGASINRSTSALSGTMAEKSTTTTERTGELMARTNAKVRGTAQELSSRAEGTAGAVGGQAKEAPGAIRQRTETNPMAAGLVALGAGFLAATLLPPTQKERQAAERLQSGLAPVKEQAGSIGRDIAGELQQSAQGRVEQLKESATEAVDRVKQDARASSQEVKEEAQQATAQVKGRTSRASRQVKQTATDEAPPSPPSPPSPRRTTRSAGTAARKAPVRARPTTSTS